MNLPGAAATAAVMNITAATALRTSAAWIHQVSVIVAGTAGGIFDSAVTGTATSGRQIAVIPATVGVYRIDMPCTSGVVVAPGTGQTLAVSLG